MPLWFIPLAFGLGVIGAVTPCAFAINALLLGYLRDKPRAERIAVALRFAGVRAVFLGLVGLLFALAVDRIGLATWRYQQAINLLLILLGALFIVDHYRPLPLPGLNLGARLEQSRGRAFGLGLLFGLDIPACASPLFFAVLSRTALSGEITGGVLALLTFGLGMSMPVIIATASERINAATAALARRRRSAFVWIGGVTLIVAGLIELLPQTMTPIMGITDQIARRVVGAFGVWGAAAILLLATLAGLLWLLRRVRRSPANPNTAEEKPH